MTKYELWARLLNTVLKDMGINKKGRDLIFKYIAELTENKKYLIKR